MKFLKKYGYEEAEELKWAWNYTFDRAVCFVRFVDGEEAWSYPEDAGYNPQGLFNCFRDEADCVNVDVLKQKGNFDIDERLGALDGSADRLYVQSLRQ